MNNWLPPGDARIPRGRLPDGIVATGAAPSSRGDPPPHAASVTHAYTSVRTSKPRSIGKGHTFSAMRSARLSGIFLGPQFCSRYFLDDIVVLGGSASSPSGV
jgi:hypothetical protein